MKLQAPASQTYVVFCVFPPLLRSHDIWSHLGHLPVNSPLVLASYTNCHHYNSSLPDIVFITVHLLSASGMQHARKLLKVGKYCLNTNLQHRAARNYVYDSVNGVFFTIAQTVPQHDPGGLILLGVLFLDVINLSFGLFLVIKHPMELFITLSVFNLKLLAKFQLE